MADPMIKPPKRRMRSDVEMYHLNTDLSIFPRNCLPGIYFRRARKFKEKENYMKVIDMVCQTVL